MIKQYRLSLIGLALLISGIANVTFNQIAQAQDRDLIPRSVLFGNPDRASVRISPDGKYISYLAPHNGLLNVWVQTLGQDDAKPITDSTTRPIGNYFWMHNNTQIVYAQDSGGDENFHLYAVDIQTGDQKDLTPFEEIRARVVATDRNFPDEILVGINNRNPQYHDVWRINTLTGESQLVYENNVFVGVIADSNFQIRAGIKFTPDGGQIVETRDSSTDSWYELVRWSRNDSLTSSLMGFARDNNTIYLLDSRNTDTAQLYQYTTGENSSYERIAGNEIADLSMLEIDPATGRPQAVGYEYLRRQWEILDGSIQEDWDYLTALRDADMSIISRTEDDKTWIVAYLRDDGPVEYHIYDREAKQATYLFSNRSALEGYALAKMKPVVIKARDGLKLVSYLTTPIGGKATNLPMVLFVHGGPWSRDSWGYNTFHQWLANRGYAVLSVNFRGSTGFGKRFVNAGDRQWARAMHDDLIDAVLWAVDEKIADPDRVAIMGGSYGGYATLVGLTFTPDFFAAGVDIVGPSDVKTLLESFPEYWKPITSLFETRVGALSEPEYLASISPINRIDAISRPLLIGQGKNDPRVTEEQSQMIVDAMQAKGLPVTYVLFPDEGHGFAKPANNLAFFAITEVFLSQHLGGKAEPISDAVAKSSAQIKAGADLIEGLGVSSND